MVFQMLKCSCSSISWFYWICRNWVEAQLSLSQLSKLPCFLRSWRWVSLSKMLPSLIFIVVFTSGKKNSFEFCSVMPDFRHSQKGIQWRDEDQSCSGKLVPPHGLKYWILIWGYVFLSSLLCLHLWRSHLWHKLIQNRFLLNFGRVFVDLYN